ncbi:MAG: dockerin type I repeat-containing protein [Ruminococcus sp.]|nr:dockerin type I repeat-containing protein [Ruminococcus sp.]
MKKKIAFLMSLVLAASALPVSAVHAADYETGDVDMDGRITGHDAAVISRYLEGTDAPLTEEQLILADVNSDGAVNGEDAAAIFANQEYALGDADMDGQVSIHDLNAAVNWIGSEDGPLTADADGDGDIDVGDYWLIMGAYGYTPTGKNALAEAGTYYYSYDIIETWGDPLNSLGDVDNDGRLTGHDSAMITRYVRDEAYTLTEGQLNRADVNRDGIVDACDAEVIMENQQYMLGDVNMSGQIEIADARLAMGAYACYAVKSTDTVLEGVQKNLADVDLDAYYEINDGAVILMHYACWGAGASMSAFLNNAEYCYMAELLSFTQG